MSYAQALKFKYNRPTTTSILFTMLDIGKKIYQNIVLCVPEINFDGIDEQWTFNMRRLCCDRYPI